VPSLEEFEGYARECLRIAGLVRDDEIKERLIVMAREWMNAAIEARGGEPGTDQEGDD
jgi:hypothetical protein